MIDRVSSTQQFQSPMALPKGQAGEAKDASPRDTATIGQNPEKEWTVLFYYDGKNNLSGMTKSSFKSVAKVGSDENVNLVAQLAVGKADIERGLLTGDPDFGGSENIGQQDMGDPATLKEFIEWGMKKYPAKNIAVVLWDHGAGFKGSMTDDETKHMIDNTELSQALKDVEKDTGKKVDVLNFNACLMAQAEVAYEIKDGAKFMVGSEEVEAGLRIPIPGLVGTTPQHKVMTDLKEGIKAKGQVTPEELAKLYVFEAKNQFGQTMFSSTQSAIDLSKMEEVKNRADDVAKLLLGEIQKDPKMIDKVRKDITKSQHFLQFDMYAKPYLDYRDMGDFAKVLRDDKQFEGTPIQEAAKKLNEAVENAVLMEAHVSESYTGGVMAGATGISTFLPKNYGFDVKGKSTIDGLPAGGTHGYENTSWAKDTSWDELLQTVAKDKDYADKILGKHKTISSIISTALPMAQLDWYDQARVALSGAAAPGGGYFPIMLPNFPIPILIPLPAPAAAGFAMFGAALKAKKGIDKIVTAATKDVEKKGKLALFGAVDTATGLASMTTCAALLAGCPAVAFPAAVATMTLGIGKMVFQLGAGIIKSHRASKMTVEEKLHSMDDKKHI